MCGIAGFSMTKDVGLDPYLMGTALLASIENRGPQATGLAWYGRQGGVGMQKRAVTASELDYYNFGHETRTAIFHTRFSTPGTFGNASPSINRNNHPLLAVGPDGKRVVGIHNGVLHNDKTLTKRFNLPRYAETDSDVIFQMLALDDPTKPTALEEIDGSMAIAWLVENTKGLYLAKGYSSPLWYGEYDGIFVFCSVDPTRLLVDLFGNHFKKSGTMAKSGDFMIVEDSKIAEAGTWNDRMAYRPYAYGAADSDWKQGTKTTTTTSHVPYSPPAYQGKTGDDVFGKYIITGKNTKHYQCPECMTFYAHRKGITDTCSLLNTPHDRLWELSDAGKLVVKAERKKEANFPSCEIPGIVVPISKAKNAPAHIRNGICQICFELDGMHDIDCEHFGEGLNDADKQSLTEYYAWLNEQEYGGEG